MINVTSRKVERVLARRGSTAVVEMKPRGAALRIVQSNTPGGGETVTTDLLAQYRLVAN